jgi:hypothetical protein
MTGEQMSVPLELFMTGLALGASRCAIACAPILLLYVAGTRVGWREGVKATLIFSLSRLGAYVLLGLLAGAAGMFITDILHGEGFATYIWVGAGIFTSLVGFLMLWGKEPRLHLCQLLMRHTIKDSIMSMALLGFVVGIASYCPALVGILTYIAFTVKDPLTGAFCALCFGLGAAIVTPLLVVGVLSSIIPQWVFKSPKILSIFRRSCGLLFLLFGARIIMSAIGSL